MNDKVIKIKIDVSKIKVDVASANDEWANINIADGKVGDEGRFIPLKKEKYKLRYLRRVLQN